MTARDATWRALRVLVAALGLTFAFGTATALADTFTVTTTADGNHGFCSVDTCTLRDAVIAANAASGSKINVPAGTYSLTIGPNPGTNDDATTGDLNITAQVTIAGAGASTTFIDAGGTQSLATDRVFRIESNGNLTLSGATIQHGHPAGADGGGILALGPLTLTDATISGNFVDSTAGGPGIAQEASVPVSLTRVQLVGNGASGSSGAVGGGGGLLLMGAGASAAVSIADSTISSNSVVGPGGGIYSTGTAPVTITNTSILGNTALAGFTGGVSHIGGGGIAAAGRATSPGWQLSGDLVAFNTAGDAQQNTNVPGGGIDEDGGDKFTVVNTTIFRNSASGAGGGYESRSGGTHTLTNVTIDANQAGSVGGSIDLENHGTMTIANTIISRGASAGKPINCFFVNGGALHSLGHNIEDVDTCSVHTSTDLFNTDPKLQLLAMNGGPTLTEALGGGSPAIDAGDNALCPPTDQRGVSRPQNGVCDIGAYEVLHSITVTNTSDSNPGSLRDAIGQSGPGTTIDFAPALNGQTINLIGGALTIPTGLTIAGPGASHLTIKSDGSDRVFDVEANEQNDDVLISGLTITGGLGSGSGATGGGGISAGTVRTLLLNGDTITGNSASVDAADGGGGGGVYVQGGQLVVTNSTVTNNTVTITGAHGGGSGGGGIDDDGGAVVVSGSVVSNNTVTLSSTGDSGADGGGGINSNGGGVTLTNSTVDNNSATLDTDPRGSDGGGGVYEDGGPVAIASSTINGNSFTLTGGSSGDNGGAGVYSFGGSTTVISSSIDGNSANITDTSSGGGSNGGIGLYSEGGALTIIATTIASNMGTVSSTFGFNGGGAVYDQGDKTTYLNSTLSGNSVTVDNPGGTGNGGGAIYAFGAAGLPMSISDSTIAGNTSNQPGGAIFDQVGTSNLKSTIVAGNSAPNCAGPGPFTSAGNNLESANTCGFTSVGDLTNTDPKLGPLQDNGGPTPTQALPANSPAVDAGSCTDVAGNPVATDQRGTSRPQPAGGKCDIGAYELATNAPMARITSPADNQSYNINQSVSTTFTCAERPGGPGLQSCVDSNGASGGNGRLDTSTAGAHTYTVTATSKDAATGTASIHYTVIGPPTATIKAPQDNQTYTINQPVSTIFSCAEASGGPGLQSCADSNGASGGSGSLDTSTAGARTYTVTATSKDGQTSTATIHYTVQTPNTAPPQSAPSSKTAPPPVKTSTGATFSGDVNPQGQTTTYFFEYGLDPSLRPPGSSTALYDQSTAPQTLPGDSSVHTVSVPVSGLVPNALYHVRLVARNASGTTFGPDQTFTTLTGPPARPPVLGQSQNAKPLTGHLFSVINGQEVPLTELQHLPSGTVLDARDGSLELITAPVHGHKPQTGVFSGAIFKVTGARNGVTTLALVEGAFTGAPSYASCHAGKAGDAQATRLSSRILQTLHSRASGRFTTRGRYAAGTVRGTQWSTTDRCDGTLIAVQVHSVLVTDFVKHISVLVKAGQHYLARARK